MKDRLSEIIGDGRAAFRMLTTPQQARLIAVHGSAAAARAHAFAALPDATRLDLILGHGAVPFECGDAAPVAPARGPVRVFTATALYPKGSDGWEAKPSGHMGRRTMQVADAFDRMRAQALRAGGADPFTPGQKAMARHYATLAQDVAASGLRCSSLESIQRGGGTPEGFTDHRLDMGRRLARLEARVGNDVAMPIRRIRPSARGPAARAAITDLALVHALCRSDLTISEALQHNGWSVKGETVRAATRAAAMAFDRMIG